MQGEGEEQGMRTRCKRGQTRRIAHVRRGLSNRGQDRTAWPSRLGCEVQNQFSDLMTSEICRNRSKSFILVMGNPAPNPCDRWLSALTKPPPQKWPLSYSSCGTVGIQIADIGHLVSHRCQRPLAPFPYKACIPVESTIFDCISLIYICCDNILKIWHRVS